MDISNDRMLLIFYIGENQYAIDIKYLQSIIDIPEIVNIPESSAKIQGIINYRGSIITVLNLFENIKVFQKNGKVLLLQNDETVLGLLVDQVVEILTVSVMDILFIDKINIESRNNCKEWISYAIPRDEDVILLINYEEVLEKLRISGMYSDYNV